MVWLFLCLVLVLLIVFFLSCSYEHSVSLSHGAVGWSAVFMIVAFPCHTRLPFNEMEVFF